MFLDAFVPFLGLIFVIALTVDMSLSMITDRLEMKELKKEHRANRRIEKMAKKMLW